MCGIAGFYHKEKNYQERAEYYRAILSAMYKEMYQCGEEEGICLSLHCGLAHSRRPAAKSGGESQPMLRSREGRTCGIVYDGALYNAKELRELLKIRGCEFTTEDDMEVVLAGVMEMGPEFVRKMNGVFAFAVWDLTGQKLYLFRDPMGVKPLFYTWCSGELIFASELKGIFAHPLPKPEMDKNGWKEIFGIGPARSGGSGVFKGMQEVLPGEYLLCDEKGVKRKKYWELESHPHEDDYEKTVEVVSGLIYEAVTGQMVSETPVCTFLSGGVDSSLVSSICAAELQKQGERLTTFSFDFAENQKNFKASDFQPSLDRPYVEKMAAYLDSEHHFLECDNGHQLSLLTESVRAHDLPAMADVDSSLLYFCSQVAKTHKVALTGECADEIFGGYPWFHKQEALQADTFPWAMDLEPRKQLLSEEFIQELQMEEYVKAAYEKSVSEVPKCMEDSREEARRREIFYLNLKWFMQTLLNRMDRTSRRCGLEARVPFADIRIVQYLWNIPWEMKAKDGVVKQLLREAGRGRLPQEVLLRRKSPYPKTYDPGYENQLKKMFGEMMADSGAPVMQFLDKKKLENFLKQPSDYGKPWYGQLMAGPQLLAYLFQINEWMKIYKIS